MNASFPVRFSLIMIAYNNVAFLKAAIESVKQQTYPHWELIIQDDASSDGTYELAQKLAENEPRIQVRHNLHNKGTPQNRVEAAQYVTGELVGHLDSDDVLYPYSLQMMADFFEKHPHIALAYSDTAAINTKGQVYSYMVSRDPEPNLAFLGWRHFGVYRRSAFEQTQGYNPLLPSCEDGDLFMQIAEKFPIARIPMVLYAQRAHDNNTSRKNSRCDDCTTRSKCHYARVWAQHAGFDLMTWKKKPSTS